MIMIIIIDWRAHMYVCICKNGTDRDIRRAVAGGCSSFSEVQACTGVSTHCGKCTRFAKLEVDEARRDLQSEPSRYAGSLALAPMGA